jgi:hypothetical protein
LAISAISYKLLASLGEKHQVERRRDSAGHGAGVSASEDLKLDGTRGRESAMAGYTSKLTVSLGMAVVL